MTTETMKRRLRRVAAKANQKKQADRRTARKTLIAKLEKRAEDGPKSRSFEEQEGGASSSAADAYDRKKNLPKSKGDDAKLDYKWEAGEGYPNDGDSPADMGSGSPDIASDGKKSKQKALDEADEQRRKNTSEMEPMSASSPSRPRPKLSSTDKRRQARRKRIAQLRASLQKTALDGTDSMLSEHARDDAEWKGREDEAKKLLNQRKKSPGEAPKDVIQKAYAVIQLPEFLKSMLPKLEQANEELSHQINLGDMKGISQALPAAVNALTQMMQKVMPAARGAAQLKVQLRAASAKSRKARRMHARLSRLEDELSRSRTLIRMALAHFRI